MENSDISSDLYLPATIRVLGIDDEDRIVIWSSDKRRLFRLEGIDALSEGKLILFGGEEAFAVAESIIKENFEKPNVLRVMKRLIADQARHRLFAAKEIVGQGVWRIPGQPGLLLVSGNRALQYHQGAWAIHALPIVGSRLIDLGGSPWINDASLRLLVDDLTPEAIRAAWEELVGVLRAWKFRNEHDCLLVAGLVVATCIQAALEFRPQVWVAGPTNAGKTALKTVLAGLWPFAEQCENESTEASVRQSIGRDSMPLLLDEQEAWHGRAKLIKTMRSGTRGGTIKRGTPSGKPMEFRVNHISWWFSIEYNLPRAADRNRFAVFELLKQEQFVMPCLSGLGLLGMKLLACAIRSADRITEVWRALVADPEFSRHGRLAEVYALPLAVFSIMAGQEVLGVYRDVMALQSTAMELECPSDEQELLNAILMARPGIGAGYPISYYLARARQKTGDDTLEECGMRKDTPGNGHVWMATEVVKRNLLAGTKWADANIKLMLRRIPGAVESKQRINGQNLNGVSLPLDVLLPPEPPKPSQSTPQLPAPVDAVPTPVPTRGFSMGKRPPVSVEVKRVETQEQSTRLEYFNENDTPEEAEARINTYLNTPPFGD